MPPSKKAKSELATQLVRLARKEHLSYDEFGYICQQARKKLKLKKPKRERNHSAGGLAERRRVE